MFHRNVLSLLSDNGTAVHLFRTLFAPAFIVPLLLPAAVTRWMLTKVLGPRRDDQGLEGRFPAYYRWCRGPSTRQLRRLRRLGYEVLDYRGYCGTPGYCRPLRLAWLDDAVSPGPAPVPRSPPHLLRDRRPAPRARVTVRLAGTVPPVG